MQFTDLHINSIISDGMLSSEKIIITDKRKV